MSTVPTRRRMSAADRREQLLDIAHAIVDAEGFHAVTPGRVATAAGVSRTVVYQQFEDLGGLFVALVDREAERGRRQFEAAAGSAPAAFTATFAGVLRAVDEHPATWRLFLVPPEGAPPILHERLALARALVRDHIRTVLLTMNPALPDPDYSARIVHAAGEELLRLRLADPEQATTERLLAHVARLTPGMLGATR